MRRFDLVVTPPVLYKTETIVSWRGYSLMLQQLLASVSSDGIDLRKGKIDERSCLYHLQDENRGKQDISSCCSSNRANTYEDAIPMDG